MKKVLFLGFTLLLSTASLANVRVVQIINHFNEPLQMIVDRNPEVVPSLPSEFTLERSEHIHTIVVPAPEEKNMAYISVQAKHSPEKSAFWGISPHRVSGYLGLGIAYSWRNLTYTTVTFCTPEEYRQKGHC